MLRILVVEDESNLAEVIETELTTDGYAVEVVGDGETAVARGRSGSFDLILLDLGLPKRDGTAVCRELRMLKCKTPILMLTARKTESERILGLELGADDYVVKPFSNPELRARVRALLRRSQTEATAVYKFGMVEVDSARAEIRVSGSLVALTATEYRLLNCFIKAAGKILPREQIRRTVWEGRRYVNDRVVDTCVLHLRSKLEPDPQNPVYFVSVRGLGYRFEGDRVYQGPGA